jgi:aconitate hydratase
MEEVNIFSSFNYKECLYHFVDFELVNEHFPGFDFKKLPFSLRVLLESNLRRTTQSQQIKMLIDTYSEASHKSSVSNTKVFATRLLLQDYTGIPVLVDLCALRQVAVGAGIDINLVNPKIPIDLIIDHSIVVDDFGRQESREINSVNQYVRNAERFSFLKWCSQAFNNTRIIPPDSGICHQVNLESLATGFAVTKSNNKKIIFPEIVIGTDSHTPTINALGVLGWGVGGIEGLTTAMGEAIEFPIPQVVGVKLINRLPTGVKATDFVLTLTAFLRQVGVVEKFVEFFGPGVSTLSVTDRATISNMSPEYGATCAFFPWDEQTIAFLENTGRETAPLLEKYAKSAGFWFDQTHENVSYSQELILDLSLIEPVIAGPKRPDQKQTLAMVQHSFKDAIKQSQAINSSIYPNGLIALAAITSCTNTANPDLIMTAGLMAKNACRLGLKVPSWVKTLFAPGSLTVSEYLKQSGLQEYLDQLGFYIDGFGCTACIGNSGSLVSEVELAIERQGLLAVSILSGNRNFSGRVQQKLSLNYLASPPLVLAYALVGHIDIDLSSQAIAHVNGQDIFLKDIWPDDHEVKHAVATHVNANLYSQQRLQMGQGSLSWQLLKTNASKVYDWSDTKGYVSCPPFFSHGRHSAKPSQVINNARILLLLGDGVTTDDISPAGNISPDTKAGEYLKELGLEDNQLHTFGSRRGNWQAMLKGAFTNPNLINDLAFERRGGFTLNHMIKEIQPILDVALYYQENAIDAIIVAGKNYGIGSSRDDAARSTRLLGVKVVIAESFERIHRSNLAAFSVLPLLFLPGQSRETFCLNGYELFSFDFELGFPLENQEVIAKVERQNGEQFVIKLRSALRKEELSAFSFGGILPMLAQNILERA